MSTCKEIVEDILFQFSYFQFITFLTSLHIFTYLVSMGQILGYVPIDLESIGFSLDMSYIYTCKNYEKKLWVKFFFQKHLQSYIMKMLPCIRYLHHFSCHAMHSHNMAVAILHETC